MLTVVVIVLSAVTLVLGVFGIVKSNQTGEARKTGIRYLIVAGVAGLLAMIIRLAWM